MLTQQLVTTVMLLHPGGEAAYEALTNWLPVDDDMKSLVGDVRPQGNEATAPSWHRRGVKVVAGLPQDDKDNEKKTTDAMGKKVDYSDLCFSIIEPPLTGSLVGINVDADSVGETQVRVFKCTSQRQRNEWVSVLSSIASDEFCSIPNDPSVRGPDHYATLKISSNASPSAIADAYKQLAKLVSINTYTHTCTHLHAHTYIHTYTHAPTQYIYTNTHSYSSCIHILSSLFPWLLCPYPFHFFSATILASSFLHPSPPFPSPPHHSIIQIRTLIHQQMLNSIVLPRPMISYLTLS